MNNTKNKLSYDSHTHFFGVGLRAVDFVIQNDTTTLSLPQHLLNQELIRGFGWSNKLPLNEFDKICSKYPNKYFCLSYFDGHKSFVSHNLIKKLGFNFTSKEMLKSGVILSEIERDDFYKLMPKRSLAELNKMALLAQDIFTKEGITKIRHLTGDINHWKSLCELESKEQLKLSIEVFFSEFMGQSLDEAIKALHEAQNYNSTLLSVKGIKLFYDGSFESSTAYTSSTDTCSPRINKKSLHKKMQRVLIQENLPLAVHTIGDLALQDVIEAYSKLSTQSEQLIPKLHLEHAPIFTKESLNTLKTQKLNCIFHFQPSHWIEDQKWYSKNRDSLTPHQIYPFDFLDKYGYEYHFGSDAPVVAPTKENTLNGLKCIEKSRSW